MKKLFSFTVLALVLSLILCSFAFAETFELRISTTQTETSMIYAGLQAAANEINEKTNGNVKVTIYPSSQLGGEEDMIDQAIAGIGIAVLSDAGRMSNYVNDIGIFNMAYFVDNYDDGLKVMNTATFKKWTDELVKQGLRILCFNYYDGARSFMQNKEIKTPEDLKGLVTRTPSAAPYNASIKAMGATPYNIAWSEVYNAIQTKMIDACEVQYTSAVSTHIYEVCKYVAKTEHINLFNCLVCGEAWFSKLPDEYKQIILDACYKNGIANARQIEAAQADLEKVLIENGMTITHVDKDEFKKAAEAGYAELGWTDLRKAIYKEAGL